MSEVRRIKAPHAPPWSGKEQVQEAQRRADEGDLRGAIDLLIEAVGPVERDWSGPERPYVAAAVLFLGGLLDEAGDSRSAIRVYERALGTFGNAPELLRDNQWLEETMNGARERCAWLRQHTTMEIPGERFHVTTPLDDTWVESLEEADAVVRRYLNGPGADAGLIHVEREIG